MQELKDCYSAMVELFVMMVLVITLLTLYVVKWVLLVEGAGEVEISGVHFKLLSILHLTMFRVVAEDGAHVLTTLNTIATTAKMFFLSAIGLVSKCLYQSL